MMNPCVKVFIVLVRGTMVCSWTIQIFGATNMLFVVFYRVCSAI